MAFRHIIVGTAGHIDHGKSTLVEALTGTNPDRLEEEKRRGITIDLGFAFLEIGEVRLGFVDVPGHERFVKNMLAGVGGIDLVLLVVAADESIKPQTREHFDICQLLGIPRGIVAITKAELVDANVLGLVRLEVEEFVRGTFLEGAPILEVSARTGSGIEDLKRELRRLAEIVQAKDTSRHVRLPIDRSFAIKGFGTVVTGTLVSGALEVEDEVELLPAGRRLRVRGLQSAGKRVARAEAGQRTAVNLAGIELEEIRRGMVLVPPGRFQTTRRLDARVSLLRSARELKDRARVHFHQGTTETIAEVVLAEGKKLEPGDSALAQLRLAEPAFLLPGDRFIIRQFSPLVTIGGGVVFDPLARRHRKGDPRPRGLLEAMESGHHESFLEELLASESGGMSLERAVSRTGWLEAEVRETAAKLAQAGRLRIVSKEPFAIAANDEFEEYLARVRAELEHFHDANPLLPGIPKEELRGRAAPGARPELFRAALGELAAKGAVTLRRDIVQRAGREITLLPEETEAKRQIEREFERAGLTVPRVEEVLSKLTLDPKRAEKVLQILIREKALVKVAEALVFHRTAVERLRQMLASYKAQRGERLPVAAFKDLTGVTRKYAIPLLEYLDREHVTRRVGDERVIL